MSIRRRLVSAVCLLSVCTVVAVGQQRSSYTEPGSVPRKSQHGTESPAGRTLRAMDSTKPAVEYFSAGVRNASATQVPASQNPASPVAVPADVTVRKERMKVAGVAEVRSGAPAGPAATAAPPAPMASKPAVSAAVAPVAQVAPEVRRENASQEAAVLPEVSLFDESLFDAAVPLAAPAPATDVTETEQEPAAAKSTGAPESVADDTDTFQAVDEALDIRTAEFRLQDNQHAPLIQVGTEGTPVAGSTVEENPFGDFSEDEPAVNQPTVRSGVVRSAAFPEASAEPERQAASPGGEPAVVEASLRTSGASAEMGPQSPGVTLEWIRHGEFNVGQTCDVELVVHNTTRTIARNVMAEAEIPTGLDIVSIIPEPSGQPAAPSWNFGTLNPGEKKSVAFKVLPQQRGELQLSAFVRLTGASAATFAVQEPLIAISVDGPEHLEVGQQVSYIVRVSNPGTGLASNVLIQAVLPEGLEHRRGSLLTVEIGTLNPGESRQAQLSLTAVRGGSHQLAIRAVAEGGLNDQAAAVVTIAEPRLQLRIAGASEQISGRREVYQLQVMNEGSVPSANVRAKYRVPEGCSFIAADRGGKYHDTDRSIEWFVGTLQAGESSEFRVTLQSVSTGKMLHQAGVISEHGKVTMAEHSVNVEGTAVLELKLAANQRQIKVGDEVTFEVQVMNTGSRAATNVGISCEMPAGLQLLQAAGPSEHIAENGILIFRSLQQIEAGRPATYTVTAKCTRDGNHRLRLRVASESISEAVIGEESVTGSVR